MSQEGSLQTKPGVQRTVSLLGRQQSQNLPQVEKGFKQIIGNKYSHGKNQSEVNRSEKIKSRVQPIKPLFNRDGSFNVDNHGISTANTSVSEDQDGSVPVLKPLIRKMSSHLVSHESLPTPRKLPAQESLSSIPVTEKYFGDNARVDFFERYHWLGHQQSITNSSTEAKIGDLLFDNEVYHEITPKQSQRNIKQSNNGKIGASNKLLSPKRQSKDNSFKQGKNENHQAGNSQTQNGTGVQLVRTSSLVLPSVFGERRCSTETVINTMYGDTGEEDLSKDPKTFAMTPRSKYLAACLNEKVNPRASLVIRKELTKEILLQHQGIGDTMAKLLSECIEGLPYLESVNISDNRLTDVSLEPMLKMLAKISNLRDLDLSQNVIGPKAAEQMSVYLRNPNCPLTKLTLQHADVDDYECKKFVETLRDNHSLTDIDLSSNKIGEVTSQKGAKDGGNGVDAIADLLASKECRIKSLFLSWNRIRLYGAVHLAESLHTNCSLVTLDVSFNSLGREGGIALGQALLNNKTLKTLSISNNNIDGEATFTICAGIIENTSLRTVTFDGNPIGELGTRAVMLVAMLAGNRVKVSAAKCNVHIKDQSSKLDFSNLARDYNLDMSDGFERAIALIILHLVCGHPTYEIRSFSHEAVGSRGKGEQLKIIQSVVDVESQEFDENQNKTIESLTKLQLASNNSELTKELFKEVDEDGSGLVDPEELRHLMSLMGIEIDDKRLADIMDTYDTSGDNQLDMQAFTLLIKGQYAETTARINELRKRTISALSTSPNVRYLPPSTGRVKFTVLDTFCVKQCHRTMTACDKVYVFEVASAGGDDQADMISFSVDSAIKLRLDEALAVFQGLRTGSETNGKLLRRILPNIINSSSAIQMIKHITGSNLTEMVKLKHEMGPSLKAIIGAPNGYYSLDMSKEMDRLCLSRLITISTTHADIIQRNNKEFDIFPRLGDVSQKGNFSCFRNEIFNGQPVTIDSSFATPMPLFGKLDFDFCTRDLTTDMSLVIPMTDKKFVKTLVKSHLLPIWEAKSILKKLKSQKKACNDIMSKPGVLLFRQEKERALQIGECQATFYKELPSRAKMVEENRDYPDDEISTQSRKHLATTTTASATIASARAGLVTSESSTKSSQKQTSSTGGDSGGSGGLSTIPESRKLSALDFTISQAEIDQSKEGFLASGDLDAGSESDEEADELVEQLESYDPEKEDEDKGKKKRVSFTLVDDYLSAFKNMMNTPTVSTQNKARKFLEVCEEIFGWSWVRARHVAALVEIFSKLGMSKRTKYFGTYRVDLIVALFDRIIDLHNFELILSILTPLETACVYCRIGWLNIYNPEKADGPVQLDISRYEERMIMKILSGLMVIEPGINWVDKRFRWLRDGDPVPGWEMIQTWMVDECLPKRGILDVTYYSGDGENKNGCAVDVPFRKSLYSLVRINEADVFEEGKEIDGKPNLLGESSRRSNMDLWTTFLSPAPKNARKHS